eukprot:g112.t1
MELAIIRSLRTKAARGEWISNEDLQAVASLIDSLIVDTSSIDLTEDNAKLLTTTTQLLSNCSIASNGLGREVWTLFYPTQILKVSFVQNDDILSPLSYALWKFGTERLWMLKEKHDFDILDNLITFYGSSTYVDTSTSFSLLLGSVLKDYPSLVTESCFAHLYEAIATSDIDCLNQEKIVSSIIPLIVEETKKIKTLSGLRALKTCLTASSTGDDITLSNLTRWAVLQLSSTIEDAALESGFKSNIVAILADLVYDNSERQKIVLDMNGVELVLNHIKLDDKNPLIREWALLFVRNMCKGNMEAQSIIAGLEFKKVLTDDASGLRFELDAASGKLKILNK